MYLNEIKPHKSGIVSKWVIEGLPDFVVGSDKNIYRLPFKSGRNYFSLRKLNKQVGNRWKLNGVWWSEKQLRPKLRLNSNPEILIKFEKDCPF